MNAPAEPAPTEAPGEPRPTTSSRGTPEPSPRPTPPPRRAVVLENLGTPDSPALTDVQAYLRQFLSDKRIVSLPAFLWQPILRLIILRRHAPVSAAKYASIWTTAGSPLLLHTQAQAAGLRDRLGPGIVVDVAMRYGRPALADALDRLRADGVTDVLLVPMYPQYSTTTTATVEDDLAAYRRARPRTADDPLRVDVLPAWPEDPGYLDACVHRITAHWDAHGRPDFAAGDKLLLSFHGIPVSVTKAGDPYPSQCAATTARLRERLHLTETECPQTYQSKFGKGEWLTPATIDTVRALAASGTRRLDVFCPGFAADCLETCEEIALLNRDAFLAAGGDEFHKIDCLNDDPAWLDALAALVRTRWSAGTA